MSCSGSVVFLEGTVCSLASSEGVEVEISQLSPNVSRGIGLQIRGKAISFVGLLMKQQHSNTGYKGLLPWLKSCWLVGRPGTVTPREVRVGRSGSCDLLLRWW